MRAGLGPPPPERSNRSACCTHTRTEPHVAEQNGLISVQRHGRRHHAWCRLPVVLKRIRVVRVAPHAAPSMQLLIQRQEVAVGGSDRNGTLGGAGCIITRPGMLMGRPDLALVAAVTQILQYIVGIDKLIRSERWKAAAGHALLSWPRVSRALGTSCLFHNQGPRRVEMPRLFCPGAAGPDVADGLFAHAVRACDDGGLDASGLGLENADDV